MATPMSYKSVQQSTPPRPAAAPAATAAMNDAQVYRNRCYLTILRYTISYPRWSFSLFLLLARLTLPQLPSPFEGVQQPLEALRNLVQLESHAYAQCVETAFRQTQPRLYNQTLQRELKRVEELQQNNQRLVQNAVEAAQSCTNTTGSAQRVLVVSKSFLRVYNSTSACSNQDRVTLNAILQGDEQYQASESLQVASMAWDKYLQSTQQALERITNYGHARSQYDYDYFIGIYASLDKLKAFEMPQVDISLHDFGVLDDLQTLLQAMTDALRDAHVRIDLLQARLELFYTSIADLHLQYTDMFGRFQLAADFARDFIPKGIALPDFFDMADVPAPDLLLPVPFDMPGFAIPLADIDVLLAQYMKDAAALMTKVIAQVVDKATDKMRAALQDMLDELQEILSLDDYNPPIYAGIDANMNSPEDEVKRLGELGLSAKQKVMAAFDRNWQIVDNQSPPNMPPDTEYSAPPLDRNATTFKYLEPQFPTISIPAFIRGLILFAFANSGVVDLVVQFIRLKRLKDRHERNSQPDLPEIDYVDEPDQDEEENEESPPAIRQVKSSVLSLFVTPWMALGLILLPLAGIFLGLYLPHVYRNCVQTQDGTFVARYLIVPVQTNHANLLGNSIYATAEIGCAVRQRRLCKRLYAQSDLVYRKDTATLQSALNQWGQPQEFAGVMNRCVDAKFMDEVIAESCCGLDGYGRSCSVSQRKELCPIDNATFPPAAFRPLGEYLGNAACREALPTALDDTHFDCNVLEGICHAVPCQSADADLIHIVTVQAVCQVEVYIMGCCFWVLVAVYHMLMIGTACSQLLNGMICVRWRSVRPDGIKLRTQMRENGELIKGFEQEERLSRIATAVQAYERVGRIRIALGSLLLTVWFISFFILRHILSKIVR